MDKTPTLKKSLSPLEKLKKQQATLTARIQLAEARSKESEHKKDTRRKILVGSYYLDQAKEQNRMEDVKNLMDRYLTRDSDRKLFDLPLLSGETVKPTKLKKAVIA